MSAFQRATSLSQSLRSNYLQSLPEPQEWFLEEMVRAGEIWEMPGEGYAVFHSGTLVEFYVVNGQDPASSLAALKRVRPFEEALCKSFDEVLVEAATAVGGVAMEVAFLFRKRTEVNLTLPDGFRLEKAAPRDIEAARKVGDEFFSSPAEVDQLLQSGGLWVAWCQSERVGCGVTFDLDGPYGAVDVGMVVSEGRRNEGFGTAIVSTLSDAIEADGKRPICGCARRNTASKATLEKAGFVSEHRLLRFEFPA